MSDEEVKETPHKYEVIDINSKVKLNGWLYMDRPLKTDEIFVIKTKDAAYSFQACLWRHGPQLDLEEDRITYLAIKNPGYTALQLIDLPKFRLNPTYASNLDTKGNAK